MSDPPEQERAHTDVGHGLGRVAAPLVVAHQPASVEEARPAPIPRPSGRSDTSKNLDSPNL
jgi:hypothetical protein